MNGLHQEKETDMTVRYELAFQQTRQFKDVTQRTPPTPQCSEVHRGRKQRIHTVQYLKQKLRVTVDLFTKDNYKEEER